MASFPTSRHLLSTGTLTAAALISLACAGAGGSSEDSVHTPMHPGVDAAFEAAYLERFLGNVQALEDGMSGQGELLRCGQELMVDGEEECIDPEGSFAYAIDVAGGVVEVSGRYEDFTLDPWAYEAPSYQVPAQTWSGLVDLKVEQASGSVTVDLSLEGTGALDGDYFDDLDEDDNEGLRRTCEIRVRGAAGAGDPLRLTGTAGGSCDDGSSVDCSWQDAPLDDLDPDALSVDCWE